MLCVIGIKLLTFFQIIYESYESACGTIIRLRFSTLKRRQAIGKLLNKDVKYFLFVKNNRISYLNRTEVLYTKVIKEMHLTNYSEFRYKITDSTTGSWYPRQMSIWKNAILKSKSNMRSSIDQSPRPPPIVRKLMNTMSEVCWTARI